MEMRIRIGGVKKKREGLSDDRRPWTLWAVVSEDEMEFTTFDGVLAHRAFNAVGEDARAEFRFGGRGERKLTGLTIERSKIA